MRKDFYLGLDVGTDSIGWAVTDEEYNILKARGQSLWGAYLFDPAKTAVERRMYRSARRRLARRVQRIKLLQDLFKEEIAKVDETFFLRLEQSKYSYLLKHKDEKIETKNILFGDKNFQDKNFYNRYPTIYHLRASLLTEEIPDIRYLYLAVHHILKNRGHFLFEKQNFDAADESDVKEIFFKINELLADMEEETFSLENLDEALDVLKRDKIGKQDKEKMLKEAFKVKKSKQQIHIIKAIVGCSASLKEIYCSEEEYSDIEKFSFDKEDFDNTFLPKIEQAVGYEEAELIRLLKSIYDWAILTNILAGEQYLSKAKIKIYEKHKYDLDYLKNYLKLKAKSREEFLMIKKLVFRHNTENNYAAYIGMDKQKSYQKCKKDDFYKFLKTTIKIDDDYILSEIEKGSFLPKQVNTDNGIIPYQVHLSELKAILSNAQKQFSFLNNITDGFTIAEKIIQLMTFRIPYFVGPLNTASDKAWVVKAEGTEKVKITPWNYKQIIDEDASEQAFINRMTNKCTYLKGEDVLAANSLLYSEYVFLNELNNLKINGIKDSNVKKLILNYAKHHKRITLKVCKSLLEKEGIIPKGTSVQEIFGGLDGDFTTSMKSYNDFYAIIGDKVEQYSEMVEQIIVWITLISNKQRLEKLISKKYGDILTEEEIIKIKNLAYSGWGRLSKKLLTEITCDEMVDSDGEFLSIIEALRQKNNNFMQLMSNKYGYSKAIDNYNVSNSCESKITYGTVENLYCSPAVKRAIWRTICLVREVTKIQGAVPKKVFVEMARDNDSNEKKGKRTVTRKQQLLDLYKSISDDKREWQSEIEETDDRKFNSDKLVLYYRQMGRCAYSQKAIPLENIFDTNICDIDHIYPQSKIKDDSLDNRVLVYKTENLRKANIYPIDNEIRTKMHSFWMVLLEKNLISERKFDRLTRNTPLTVEELSDFINRQLVETRQSTKEIANILKTMLPTTEIVYSKASIVNDFKQDIGFVKVRELNDLHHAKDAYFNIVVGNVYNTKFSHNAQTYFKENNTESYDIRKLFNYDLKGAWKVGDKKRVCGIASKNDCTVVRFATERNGALYNATIKCAGERNNKLIPLKGKGHLLDTTIYGGYDNATIAYFALVKSIGKKNKTLLSLEPISILADIQCNGKQSLLENYLENVVELKQPNILIKKIRINTLLNIDGSYAYLRGKSVNSLILCNASQLYLDDDSVKYLKSISNYFKDIKKLNKRDICVGDDITKEQNLKLYNTFIDKISSKRYTGLNAISNQVQFLKEKENNFIELTEEQQCKILFEVLHLLQANSVMSDFSLLQEKGAANIGSIKINKFIQDKSVKIINCSPTGYYASIVDLKRYL